MKRDKAIEKSYKREINLGTKVVKDKTKYSRKAKHKKKCDHDIYFLILFLTSST